MVQWKQFWEQKAKHQEAAVQVGRVVNGQVSGEDVLQKIAHKIARQLDLQKGEIVLDVCCGNGLLDAQLLAYCSKVHGVDFSENLIQQAKALGNNNLNFTRADASNYAIPAQFDKGVLYFSFQYFEDTQQAKQVLQHLLHHIKPGGLVLIGDITDARKFFVFYHSPLKVLRWMWHTLRGKNTMGRFWHPKELIKMCEELGATANVQEQEAWQPYSHYRFDLLIQKGA